MGRKPWRTIVIHAAKDLRIEERAAGTPGAGQVAVKLATGGICGSTFTITITAASGHAAQAEVVLQSRSSGTC